MPELHVEPEEAAVVVEADLDVVHLAALVGRGDEVLAPVLDELHRPAQRPRRERYEQLLGPRVVDLHPEAAADVGRHHVDLAEVEAELDRDRRADPGRGLGRRPHRQPVDVGVPAGDGAAALHRLAGAALDRQVEGQRVRRRLDRGLGVAVVLLHAGAHVAGHVLVHQARGGAGGLDADDRRQHLVVDPDPTHGVLGDVAVVGDHERDRLADVVDLAVGERVLRAAVGQRRVRDQQRQRLGHRWRQSGEVLVGPHHVHALDVEDVLDVDVEHLRVRVRRAQHGGVQGVRADGDVVDVPALPAQEALVLDPLDGRAEELGRHAPNPVDALSSSRSS